MRRGRLRRDDPETAGRLMEHECIVAFRNVLIHGYDLADDEIVGHASNEAAAAALRDEYLLEEKGGP